MFVVSYDEKVPIGEDINFTIVDGLIGQVFAHRHFQSTITEVVEQHQELFKELPPNKQHEYIQQLVTDTEVEAELTWDPISIKASQFEGVAHRKGIWKGLTIECLNDPELPEGDPFDVEVLKRRIEAFKHVRRVGCRVL